MPAFPVLVLLSIALLAATPMAAAKTDLRKPLHETHACTPVGRWCLQSNAWINLHQRLVAEARYGAATPKALAGNDRVRWQQAVERYRTYLGERSLLFDAELVALDAELSRTTREALPPAVPDDAAAVLAATMPLYRKAQWKADDRGNRFFIALAKALIEQAGGELVAAHEKAYGRAFPTRILVDVSAFGGQFGAYAVGEGDEVHVVQSHSTPAAQGLAALESLVHEPAHAIVDAERGAIGDDLARASAATGVEPRHNLWHAMLFYTAGELTRRAYARRGIDYVPFIRSRYAGPFAGMQAPLETHWQAYLDGKLPRDEAVRRVLVETTAAMPKR